MRPAFLFAAHLAVGTALGVWNLWRMERRPADRLSLLPRAGVWSYLVGMWAVWWPALLLSAGLAAAWRRACGGGGDGDDEPVSPIAFPTDADGCVVLGRGSGWGSPVGAAALTLFAIGMLIGAWVQEGEWNALTLWFMAFTPVIGTVPSALILRHWRARRDGLRAEDGPNGPVLLWTEIQFWTPHPRRLPLGDIDRAATWESDPIGFDCGLALALHPRAEGLGNVPAWPSGRDDLRYTAASFPQFDADLKALPPDRLVVWPAGA